MRWSSIPHLVRALAVTMFLCAAARAETYEFHRNLKAGDSFTFNKSENAELHYDVYSGQMLVQKDVGQTMQQLRSGKVEILEAEGGEPSSIRVTFDRECSSSMETTGQGKQEAPFAFAGKTVTLGRKADGSLDLDTPTDDVAAIAELRALLDRDEGMYPDHAVEIGDTWEVGKEAVAKSFNLGPDDTGRGAFKLVDVKDVNGRPTAEIETELEASKADQSGKLTLHVKGTMFIDLATGEQLVYEVSGPMTHEAEITVDQNGTPAKMRMVGKGKTSIKAHGAVEGDAPRHDVKKDAPKRDPGDNPLAKKKKPADAPFNGTFETQQMRLVLKQTGADITGTLALGQDEYPVHAVAKGNYLSGTFGEKGESFDFTAELDGSALKFETEGSKYELTRTGGDVKKKKNPLKQ